MKWFAAVAVFVIIGLGYFLYQAGPAAPANSPSIISPSPSPSSTSHEGSFRIITNGTKRDFSDIRYHNLSDSVFLTPDDPTIVHVRAPDTTWQQFFDTLPMKLSAECLVTGTKQKFCDGEGGNLIFTLNGVDDPQALTRVIGPGDNLLVAFVK